MTVLQFPKLERYAQCPMCGSMRWFIKVDDSVKKILEICCFDCQSEMIIEEMELEKNER